MKGRLTLRIAGALITALAAATASQAGVIKAKEKVPGQYIVVLKPGLARAETDPATAGPTVPEVANSIAARFGGHPGRSFSHALKGFVLKADAASADRIADDPRVAYVEEDGIVHASGIQVAPLSWGLDRIDQRDNALDGKFVYYDDGAGVDIYIIDTGVRSTHQELAGRVDTENAFSAVNDGLGTEDPNGHGTAVAAVAAGITFGVAKAATIHPVRVLRADGLAPVSSVVYGLDWVTANHPRKKTSIANLSIESGPSPSLDDAIRNCVASGVFVTVAAGNSDADACGVSPARVFEALTTGASNSLDERASFSNYGTCVDLFAPGRDIPTAWSRSDDDVVTASGTSFAAPFAAGTAALYLQQFPDASPDEVKWALINPESEVIPDDGTGSPTGLLYSGFISNGLDLPPYASFTATCRVSRVTRCRFDAGASVDDHKIVSYAWEFGDGTTAVKKNTKTGHRFPKTGSAFTVTLTVTDNSGQSTQVAKEILLSN